MMDESIMGEKKEPRKERKYADPIKCCGTESFAGEKDEVGSELRRETKERREGARDEMKEAKPST